ncbi:unnamed protein product [Sympodiomycopsis kandeliae]
MNSAAAVAPGLANGHAPYGPGSDNVSSPVSIPGPTSPQSSLIASGQKYVIFPSVTLESGITLENVPLAYKTWGKLNPETKDNVLVVAHALTGSADVEDWWGPLLGPGKLFDPTRYFIFCANTLGSPYGSAGPCTRKGGEDYNWQTGQFNRQTDWDGKGWWGPEFPATTVRDDVKIQKAVLEFLGVQSIAAVVGGSMGGMAVLEWPLLFPVRFPRNDDPSTFTQEDNAQKPYISAIIPIATAARHGAWCISWAEAQRQSIYSDPMYSHGYYAPDQPPRAGLAAARMAALLTYRSRDSFENRFGRRIGAAARGGGSVTKTTGEQPNLDRRASHAEEAVMAHNEGNQTPRPDTAIRHVSSVSGGKTAIFSAQSYLRYQGDKFVKRFDANCYVHLTRKMDTHDLARGRAHWGIQDPREAALEAAEAEKVASLQHGHEQEVLAGEKQIPHGGQEDDEVLSRVLSFLSPSMAHLKVHIISISSDGLFQTPEQELIHHLIPGSTFQNVGSPEGHDGFLLEFEAIEHGCKSFLQQVLPTLYKGEGVGYSEWKNWQIGHAEGGGLGVGGESSTPQGKAVKESVFGEIEDVTRW